MGAAAEGQHLDVEGGAAGAEFQPADQLSGGEVVGLVAELHQLRLVAHPDAFDGQVGAERIGSHRRRLHVPLVMLSGEAQDDAHAGSEGVLAHTQPDEAVRDIGGQGALAGAAFGRRADRTVFGG